MSGLWYKLMKFYFIWNSFITIECYSNNEFVVEIFRIFFIIKNFESNWFYLDLIKFNYAIPRSITGNYLCYFHKNALS